METLTMSYKPGYIAKKNYFYSQFTGRLIATKLIPNFPLLILLDQVKKEVRMR